MRTSLFAFAQDLRDEGAAAALGAMRERAGVDDVTFAAVYHAARDLVPHARSGRLRWMEGAAYFRLDRARWRGQALVPRESPLCAEADPLAEAFVAGEALGMGVNAWVVYLHADGLGFEHPECAPETAFGDRLLTDLCPAHPDVRAYALTLTAEVAARGARTIRAESLHHASLGHGYHHERAFVPLDPLAQLLLGLCFCAHCTGAGRAAGVEVDALRAWVRDEVDRRLAVGPEATDPSREEVAALASGELGVYLTAREATVTTLAAEVAATAVEHGSTLTFMDPTGAAKGYADGRPQGGPAAAEAWKVGIDLAAVAAVAPHLQVLGYAVDPARLAADLDAYTAASPAPLALALRPMWPDCDGPDNLAAKVAVARAAGVRELDLYHYGLAPLASLDWIAEALRSG